MLQENGVPVRHPFMHLVHERKGVYLRGLEYFELFLFH